MTKAKTKTSGLVDSVKESITSRKVWVRCTSGTLPLEWPRVDGRPCVDDATLMPYGNKLVKTAETQYRNIDTRIVNEHGVGGQSAGYMELDLLDESHPLESDAKFLARIKDWLKNSGDRRIARHGVRIEEGNPFPLPFAGWDTMKEETLLDFVAAQLGDDHATNVDLLTKYASYELSRTVEVDGELQSASRQGVLDGLDILATAPGDESEDASPEDESA